MAKVFTVDDLSALIAAFPPSSPSKHTESAIFPNAKAHAFVTFNRLRSQVTSKLAHASQKLLIDDLAASLDVQDLSWLLQDPKTGATLNRDRRYVFSLAKLDEICAKLLSDAETEFINLSERAAQEDVTPETLRHLLYQSLHPDKFVIFAKEDGSHGEWLTSKEHRMSVESTLLDTFQSCSDDVFNLSSTFPSVPGEALLLLARTVLDKVEAGLGDLRIDANQLSFIPTDYEEGQKLQKDAEHERSIVSKIEELMDNHYAILDDAQMAQELKQRLSADPRFESGESLVDLRAVPDKTSAIVLMEAEWLSSVLQRARQVLPALVRQGWLGRSNEEIGTEWQMRLLSTALEQDVKVYNVRYAILCSEHAAEAKEHLEELTVELQAHDQKAYCAEFRTLIHAPIRLHAIAIDSIADTVLKEHLDQFCGDYIRREVYPGVIKSLGEHKLLLDKARSRAIEKLSSTIAETKTLTEINTDITKFAKKHKIGEPSAEELKYVKAEHQQRKLKAIRSGARGSDVLQNLLWILLGSRTEGVYLSSGKDTSRMIKHYKNVGDVKIAERLSTWRDKLKSNEETTEDLQQMRQLATETLEHHT